MLEERKFRWECKKCIFSHIHEMKCLKHHFTQTSAGRNLVICYCLEGCFLKTFFDDCYTISSALFNSSSNINAIQENFIHWFFNLVTFTNIKLPTWTKLNRHVRFQVALYYRIDIC